MVKLILLILIEGKIDTGNAGIVTANTGIVTANTGITNANTKLTTIDGKSNTIITNIATADAKIVTANTGITNANTKLTTVDGKVDNIILAGAATDDKLMIASAALNAIYAKLPVDGNMAGQNTQNLIVTSIAAMPTTVVLNSTVDNAKLSIENKISTLSTNVGTIDTKVNTLNTKADDLVSKVTEVYGKLPTGSLIMASQSSVNNANTKLDELATSVGNIQNNTAFSGIVNLKFVTPSEAEGTKTYKIYALIFDNGGIPADADLDTVSIIITDNDGVVISNADMVSLPETGSYSYDFVLSYDTTPGPIFVRFTYMLEGVNFIQMRTSEIFDLDYSVTLADIKRDTETINNKADVIDAEILHIDDLVSSINIAVDPNFQRVIKEIHGVTCNSWDRNIDTNEITIKDETGTSMFKLQPLPGKLGRLRSEV